MKIKGNYVLIRTIDADKKTKSGIILTDQSRQAPGTIGEVIAVGEGTYHESFELKDQEVVKVWKLMPIDSEIQPGRKVIYPRWAGYEVEIDDEKFLMVREHDILATIEE